MENNKIREVLDEYKKGNLDAKTAMDKMLEVDKVAKAPSDHPGYDNFMNSGMNVPPGRTDEGGYQ